MTHCRIILIKESTHINKGGEERVKEEEEKKEEKKEKGAQKEP